MTTPRDSHSLFSQAGPPRSASYGTEGAARPSRTKQIEQVMDLLYRRRWTVIAVFLLALGLAGVYARTQTPVFQSDAIVMVDLSRVPSGESVVPQEGTPFVRSDRSVATELFIIKTSPTIADRVDKRMETMGRDGRKPSALVSFGPADRTVASALKITAVSTNRDDAALLANAYAEEYVRQTQEASRTFLVYSREYLEEQQATRSAELQRAEDALEAYMRSSGALEISQAGSSVISRIATMEASRDDARINLQVRQANLASIERELAAINPRLAERMSSGLEREMQGITQDLQRLESQKREIINFEQTQGRGIETRRAELAALDGQIRTRQAELQRLAQRHVDEVMASGGAPADGVSYAAELQRRAMQDRIEMDGLNAQISTMERRLGEYQGQASQVPGVTTDLARLQRDQQHAQAMNDFILDKLEQTRVSEGLEPGYARILQRAAAPQMPTNPGLPRLLGFGFLLGLPLALAAAFARDRFDNKIYKPDQVRERGLGVLGIVPNLKPLIRQAHKNQPTAERDGAEVSTNLVTLLAPVSAPSEAYRHLRTAIQFSRPGIVVQSVLVTSAGPGEGKSTTAANIALSMAQARRRTLLIDADLRRPQLHALFGLEREPGLAQILLQDDAEGFGPSLEQALRAYQSPHDEHLFVLPAGGILGNAGLEAQRRGAGQASTTIVENPSELLGSKRMRDLLDAARGLFDVVILDTPPVLAATDAVLLSTQADATVLVVGAGKTKEGDLDHTLEMLGDVGARVVGSVLNGFDLAMAYGYRYSYGHYSRFGPYSKHGYTYGAEPEPKRGWWQRVRQPGAALRRSRTVSGE